MQAGGQSSAVQRILSQSAPPPGDPAPPRPAPPRPGSCSICPCLAAVTRGWAAGEYTGAAAAAGAAGAGASLVTRNWLVSPAGAGLQWMVCTHFDHGVGWAQWTAGGRRGHTRELLNVVSDTVISTQY